LGGNHQEDYFGVENQKPR